MFSLRRWQAPKSVPASSTPSAPTPPFVQRCLEATTGPEEHRKIVACMRGRIVDLAPNCCGYCVLQKALDCKEKEVCLLTGSELLRVDPATTLVNKHASHVSNK
ncbi:hypothetical protein B0H14DRAFT_2933994, partial [Mycena olivaceomarginata]